MYLFPRQICIWQEHKIRHYQSSLSLSRGTALQVKIPRQEERNHFSFKKILMGFHNLMEFHSWKLKGSKQKKKKKKWMFCLCTCSQDIFVHKWTKQEHMINPPNLYQEELHCKRRNPIKKREKTLQFSKMSHGFSKFWRNSTAPSEKTGKRKWF